MHPETIHSSSLFPHFVMLQPYSKMDSIHYSPQNSKNSIPFCQCERSLFEIIANVLKLKNEKKSIF